MATSVIPCKCSERHCVCELSYRKPDTRGLRAWVNKNSKPIRHVPLAIEHSHSKSRRSKKASRRNAPQFVDPITPVVVSLHITDKYMEIIATYYNNDPVMLSRAYEEPQAPYLYPDAVEDIDELERYAIIPNTPLPFDETYYYRLSQTMSHTCSFCPSNNYCSLSTCSDCGSFICRDHCINQKCPSCASDQRPPGHAYCTLCANNTPNIVRFMGYPAACRRCYTAWFVEEGLRGFSFWPDFISQARCIITVRRLTACIEAAGTSLTTVEAGIGHIVAQYVGIQFNSRISGGFRVFHKIINLDNKMLYFRR